MHIDSLNCFKYGFNAVFGMFFLLERPSEKSTCLTSILGYSRKSIHYVTNRFQKHVQRYASYFGECDTFCLEYAILFKLFDTKKPAIITKRPFMDKCGFYSIFASAIYDVIKSPEKNWKILWNLFFQ